MTRESEFRHRTAEESLPARCLLGLFFVSIGVPFDTRMLVDEPQGVLASVTGATRCS